MKLYKSKKLYKKSLKKIAAPSTFSKGIDEYLSDISPFAINKGQGAYTWDIDGNKYIDTIMSLGTVILGHSNKIVNQAIRQQLKKGISFSLTTKLEYEVAEILCDRIPSAEMVRFGKNGNDSTTAAIRLARHYTQKDHILFCGYHAWQDWYICQTSMNSGIPKDIKKFSHRFKYNDLKDLENLLIKFSGKVSCIIMEPVSKVYPKKNYLKNVRKLADKHDVLLIFDEVVTGFRFSNGGYETICNVKPDLSCFSKALANGMPLSALVGKKEIMKESDKIFYSLTYGGETLSLAAAKATLSILNKTKAYKKINYQGTRLIKGINKIIQNENLQNYMQIIGFPAKSFIVTFDHPNSNANIIRDYVVKELNASGILTQGANILSLSHNNYIIDKILDKYSGILNKTKKYLDNNQLKNKLGNIKLKKSLRDIM